MDFATKLSESGLNLGQLAEELGVWRGTVSEWKRKGRTAPKYATAYLDQRIRAMVAEAKVAKYESALAVLQGRAEERTT